MAYKVLAKDRLELQPDTRRRLCHQARIDLGGSADGGVS